jgi:glycine betaine/choline ABC-type transport system substrate-binding protein
MAIRHTGTYFVNNNNNKRKKRKEKKQVYNGTKKNCERDE